MSITVRKSAVTAASISIQPKPLVSTSAIVSTTTSQKLSITNILASLAVAPAKSKFSFDRFDFKAIYTGLYLTAPDRRYNDELPHSTAKFTAFEELSGIASSRPDILSVSEFKPLFEGNNSGFTAAGEFMDAQVKLMNLRHEAVVTLVNDLKKDEKLAEQLDQIERDFLLHVENLKSQADFLVSLQKYIQRLSNLLDLRDTGTKIDAAALLAQYYSSIYNNVTSAKDTLPIFTYADLLGQHGFDKKNVNGFSSTKILLQTLFEAKKILRAGSDSLVSVDVSLAAKDKDASTINRRVYSDPHVKLGKITDFPSFSDVATFGIHNSDTKRTSYVKQLENGFRAIDTVYAGASSDEIAYTLKLRTFAREASYSKALNDPAVSTLLSQYGYQLSTTVGNQQLFDAVYGQLGSRITDDRTGVNANSLSSIASRIVGDVSVLTYEVDYLEDDQGSVFTPGAAFYIGSTVKPSDNGFSIDNAAALVSRLSTIIDKYVDFVGKFNILPRVGNILNTQSETQLITDPSLMTNALYSIFVESDGNHLMNDVEDNPIVNLFAEAATNATLRANLHLYMCCVGNVTGDGLVDAVGARENAGVSLSQESLNAAAAAENRNAAISPTIDKLINNCISYYKSITKDSAGAAKIEHSLKNFNEQGPLARSIAYVVAVYGTYKKIAESSPTRYSHLTDNMMVALSVQSVFDTARRYASAGVSQNVAMLANQNFAAVASSKGSLVASLFGSQTTTQHVVAAPTTKTTAKALGRVKLPAQPTVAVKAPVLSRARITTKLPLKQAVLARLDREETLSIRTALAPLNAIRVVRDGLKDYVVYLQKADSVKMINDILAVVGDRKLVELLGDRGQVQLLYNTVEGILEKIDPASTTNATVTNLVDVTSLTRSVDPAEDLKIFDDSFITSKTLDVLKAVFSNAKYNIARGSNIRVITFGLPHGFAAKLRNKFKLTSFAEQVNSKLKQNDVVIADVYKVDVRYPDLVFKPISRVFELSRFPVRNENSFKKAGVGMSLEDALDAVPTRDYTNIDSPVTTTDVPQFGSGANVAYDFLTKLDRLSMIRNHTTSYMLELYFRILTGIPLSERELYIADPDENDRPMPFIVRAVLNNITEKTFKAPPPPPTPKVVPPMLATAKLAEKGKWSAVNGKFDVKIESNGATRYLVGTKAHAAAIAPLAGKKTVYIDHATSGKYMMSPKLFERVFFVDIDPDDYEIDHDETFKTEAGRKMFTQLQQAGEVVTITNSFEQANSLSRDTYKLKDHTIEKQMIFEKYFITVRSYAPLPVRSI